MRTRLISEFLFTAAAFLFAAAVPAAQDLATQTSSAAGVTVRATPRLVPGSALEFAITFDTHSQEIKDDLMKSATLVVDGKTFVAAGWQGDPPGGHHRKGVLRFNAVDPQPKAIELRLARAGESDARKFRWQLK